VVLWLSCLPLYPWFSGSNQAGDDRFLMVIKESSMTSFGGEVKPSIPCCKILLHIKEPYRYEKRYLVGKTQPFLATFITFCYYLSLRVSAVVALVGESRMIRTQMVTYNRSVMVAEHGTTSVIPPRNSRSNSKSACCLPCHVNHFLPDSMAQHPRRLAAVRT
jgi:hypothetical protein